MFSQITTPSMQKRTLLNKVPELTYLFWILKIMSTAFGEMTATFLILNLPENHVWLVAAVSVVLAACLVWQMEGNRYQPWPYWMVVVVISIIGTLIEEVLLDHLHINLSHLTAITGILLIAVFILWFFIEKSLDVTAIVTPRREVFYWLVVLVTFVFGAAAGDLVAEGFNLAISSLLSPLEIWYSAF